MELKEIKTTENGVNYKKKVAEVPSEPSADSKSFIRYKIKKEVFDTEDSLADTTKWLSLLTTVVSNMYSILDDSQKVKLDENTRNMIEYAYTKFKETNTRGDVQFAEEGTEMIDKIFTRQAQVGEIVK